MPVFAKASNTLEPSIRLIKINIEDEQSLAAHYNIGSIPTLALLKGGREITRQSGAMSEKDLVRWAQSVSQEGK